MKQMNIKIMALSLTLGCFSCSDVLDKKPLDKFSEDDIWGSPELTQAFIYPTLNDAARKLVNDDSRTDNDVIVDRSGDSKVNKEQIDRYYDAGWNAYDESVGLDVYEGIRNCNLVLENMKNSSFLEKDKTYFTAQAKMLRAMIYYSRARLFGKLMIVDRLIDKDENMEFPRTNTIKETYDFILKDLQEAAPDLPVTLSNQQGMLTQGAAYALIAEVALHGAAYIETGQNDYYMIAKEASEALFNLNAYELDTDYEKMFNDFDYALNSKEIIFAQWEPENGTTFADTWMQGLIPNVNNSKIIDEALPKLNDSFEGWVSMLPSVDLVNTYQVIDKDGKAKDWDKTSYYQDYKVNGGYVSQTIYKNRDARFYSTIVYDSTQYFNSLISTRKLGNLHWDSRISGDWGIALTGYLYRKGVYTKKPLWYADPTYYHYIIMRLGRSYLNYAETMLRLNDANTAIEYINKTRTAHGKLPALPTGLPIEEVWKEYKRERRLELVHESDRYWSLLRWGKADGKDIVEELTKVHQSISISEDGKSFEHILLPYRSSENERIFTKKRYLFPVPQSERDLNPSLDQNDLW